MPERFESGSEKGLKRGDLVFLSPDADQQMREEFDIHAPQGAEFYVLKYVQDAGISMVYLAPDAMDDMDRDAFRPEYYKDPQYETLYGRVILVPASLCIKVHE